MRKSRREPTDHVPRRTVLLYLLGGLYKLSIVYIHAYPGVSRVFRKDSINLFFPTFFGHIYNS